MYDNAVSEAHARYDDFFKWVPDELVRSTYGTVDDALGHNSLIEVTDDMIAEYRATILPPDPSPYPGFYIRIINSDGIVTAYRYATEDAAVTDIGIVEDLYGEDPFDEADY